MLMKEIRKDLNKYTHTHTHTLYSWFGRLIIVKVSILQKLTRFNEIPIKISPRVFIDIYNLIIIFFVKSKSPRLTKTILKEKG